MEALKRKPDLSVRKTMELADGTKISVIGVPARKTMEISNNKKLTDIEIGTQLTAAKILVNGEPIVVDDLLDCFTADEMERIVKFANDIEDDEENGKKNG